MVMIAAAQGTEAKRLLERKIVDEQSTKVYLVFWAVTWSSKVWRLYIQ